MTAGGIGQVCTADERVSTDDRPNILLERWSDEGRRSPGWVQKALACECIKMGNGSWERIVNQKYLLHPVILS